MGQRRSVLVRYTDKLFFSIKSSYLKTIKWHNCQIKFKLFFSMKTVLSLIVLGLLLASIYSKELTKAEVKEEVEIEITE